MNKSNDAKTEIGFFSLLTIALITLKITNYIAWSWWWVLFPVWILPVLIIIISLILAYLETFHKE